MRGFRPLGPSPLTPPSPRWGEGGASGETAACDRGRRIRRLSDCNCARLALAPAEHPADRLRRHRRLAGAGAGRGAARDRVHRRHRTGLRRLHARQFRRGLCLDAHPAPVRQLGRLRARHRGRDLLHRRLRRLGGRAHRCAGPHAVSQSGAAVVRRSRPADGDGVDFRAQPQYRLGQCRCEIRIPPEQRAGQHLHHGRHDLGAVEPLFPARLSRHRAGVARARRAHGGGRPDVRRPLLARAAEDHAAAAAPGYSLRPAAALHHGHVVLRSAAPDRPAGAHRRLHHGNPERHLERAAGIRRRQRAEPAPCC